MVNQLAVALGGDLRPALFWRCADAADVRDQAAPLIQYAADDERIDRCSPPTRLRWRRWRLRDKQMRTPRTFPQLTRTMTKPQRSWRDRAIEFYNVQLAELAPSGTAPSSGKYACVRCSGARERARIAEAGTTHTRAAPAL
jgi:hypothetical protein